MKRRILLSCIALCSAMLGAMAQASYTFNAVAYNVDGLPPSVDVSYALGSVAYDGLNKTGPMASGTTENIANAIANANWGIVGLSEDFNYHSTIETAVKNYYHLGKHGGTVATSYSIFNIKRNSTDGLGILCAKNYKLEGETIVKWNDNDGSVSEILGSYIEDSDNIIDNGADELITKGFRYYKVTIATNVVVDVYVLHMDAASRTEDIAVREKQLTQLANYIKSHDNGRHVLILGDTNCRYTREKIKTGFIDAFNGSNFEAKDAWIELVKDGIYPTYGAESLSDEVVDKIFYLKNKKSNINIKANYYLHDKSIAGSDHYPVVVNFTLTDPNGQKVSQELEGVDETVETWTDKTPTNPTAITSGTAYYLRNVHSGLFLKGGMNWGAHIGEGVDGMPITMTKVSNNTYKLSSSVTNCVVGTNLYTDNGDANAGNWTIEEIKSTSNKGNSMTKYIVKTGSNAIASSGNGSYADFAAYNKADTKQQWVLYTAAQMKAAIKAEAEATLQGAQYNASGLITLPVCCHENESRQSAWTKTTTVAVGGRGEEKNAAAVWEVFRDGASHAFDFYQTVSGLPNGTYTVKVQAFFRDGNANTQSTNVEPVLYAGNKSKTIHSILDGALPSKPSWTHGHNGSKGWIPNDMWQANQWFKAGHYVVTLENVTVTNGTLKIGIKNTSTATSMAWCCFDNFQLYYHGTAQGDLRTSALYKRIKAAADEAIDAVESINSAEATAAFDISAVAYRYNNNLVSADGAWEFAAIDKAVKTAVTAQTAKGANMSLLIENNSFEKGSTEGWTIAQKGLDTNAFKNEGEGNTTAYGDGAYYFNTWSGWEDYGCGMIYQDITGLRNGYYKLNALVASWGHKSVYLVGNKQSASIATTAEAATFVDFGLDFLVEDGTARIGAVGAGEDGNLYFKKGIFFKADNFRLTYMGSTGEGRVKCALADAKAKADKLHEGAKNKFYNAVAQYENATVTGDGKTEEAAIYNALKAAIATQPRTETDMTWLITNPGFETGDWTGWSRPEAWESVVLHATHGNAPGNGEGQYVVNVWNNQAGIEGSGINKPTFQSLSGLPNGRYRLTANVTSDGGNPVAVYATTTSKTVNDTIQPTNNWTFKTKSIEFEVADGKATIGVVGYRNGAFNLDGGCWYKADNFRLTYLGHELNLDEKKAAGSINDWYTKVDVLRTIKPGVWSTFVVPFDIPKESITDWVVMTLNEEESEVNGDKITITFDKVTDGIKAGVPYMVRNTTMGKNLTKISMENVQVNTTPENTENAHVEFVGTYTNGTVPSGAFFISNNVFYQAANDNITLKAFRAYFVAKSPNARALNYRFAGEGGTTAIDNSQLANDNEITVVGIYTLGGVRINDMQEGVNILQMSDGSVVKVVIN